MTKVSTSLTTEAVEGLVVQALSLIFQLLSALFPFVVISGNFLPDMSEDDFWTWLTSNGMCEEDVEVLKGIHLSAIFIARCRFSETS